MLHALELLAAALAAATAALVVLLAVRRLLAARADRRRAALAGALRPLALDVVDGEDDADVRLTRREAGVLAEVLARYGREVSGDARERITGWFEVHGHVEAERAGLRARRALHRAGAATALGDMGSRAALADLLGALADRHPDVRAAAARALGRLQAPEAATALTRALADGSVPRSIAGRALLATGVGALPALRALLRAEDVALRATAAELVGLLGDAAEKHRLVALLSDPAAEVRAKACRALGRVADEDATAPLRAVLEDRIAFVRAAAADALGRLGDRDAVPALARLAHAGADEPAAAAAAALLRIAPGAVALAAAAPGAPPHLLEAADLSRSAA